MDDDLLRRLAIAIEKAGNPLNDDFCERLSHEVQTYLIVAFRADGLTELDADGQAGPSAEQVHIQIKRFVFRIVHIQTDRIGYINIYGLREIMFEDRSLFGPFDDVHDILFHK
jgi:hypothetical protein